MSKETYIKLADRISWRNAELVSDTLQSSDAIDITQNDGEFLRLAIEGDGDVEITRLLLRYYETAQLPKLTVGSTEYALLKLHLKSALEIAIEGETLSDEMIALLVPYIGSDSVEHSSLLSPHDDLPDADQDMDDDIPSHEDQKENSYDGYQMPSSTAEYRAVGVGHSTGSGSTVLTTAAIVEHTEDFLNLRSYRDKAEKLRVAGDECRIKSKNLKDAEECYRESVDFDPQYYCSYRQLGKLCHKDGRYIEAIEYYVKAIVYKTRSDTQYEDVYKGLRELVQRYQSEIELMFKVDELRPIIKSQHQELLEIFAEVQHMPDVHWPLSLVGEHCGDALDA